MKLPECEEQWIQLTQTDATSNEQLHDFLRSCSAHATKLIRASLKAGNPREREYSFRATELLDLNLRQELLPDLVVLACEPSYVPTILRSREVLLTFPKEWLCQHIETAAEPLLASEDEWVYRRLLELYARIEISLTLRLANRAVQHPNPEIQRAGEEFLDNPHPR
jgi:hypothetical protein